MTPDANDEDSDSMPGLADMDDGDSSHDSDASSASSMPELVGLYQDDSSSSGSS